MSFKKYLEEANNASGLSKEQKLVLLIGKELEELNYKLKNNTDERIFQNFKNKEDKFSYDFIKNNNEINLVVKNKKDGNYEISMSNDKRTTSEEIKIDNYIKDKDNSLLSNYIKDRIKNIESNPLLYNDTKNTFKYNTNNHLNINIDRNEMNDNLNNNFIPNPYYNNDNNNIRTNFANIGYNDLHGDLPNFVPGYNDYFGSPKGNLMGPEAFNIGGMRRPGGIRYDPITPFGPRFDFIPQYDGPMKRTTDPRSDIDIGIPKWQTGNKGFDDFGGGGYNPFI